MWGFKSPLAHSRTTGSVERPVRSSALGPGNTPGFGVWPVSPLALCNELPMTLRARHPTGTAKPGEPNDRPRAPAPPPPPRWRMWLLPAGVLVTVLLLSLVHTSSTPTKNFSYSTFLSQVDAGKVKTASVNPSGAISGTLKGGDNYTSQIPTAIDDTQLAPILRTHQVNVT